MTVLNDTALRFTCKEKTILALNFKCVVHLKYTERHSKFVTELDFQFSIRDGLFLIRVAACTEIGRVILFLNRNRTIECRVCRASHVEHAASGL